MKRPGTLYAIGVGPGDPELLTVKAAKVLERIRFLFTATSGPDKQSLALSIALPFLKNSPETVALSFPMVRDREVLRKAWDKAASKVLDVLNQGHDAAFVTLGDPSTYSTFTYLFRSIKEKAPNTEVQIIPGITSFQAAAARVQMPLAEGEESLTIVSGAKGGGEIRRAAAGSDNLVIMKAYRHYDQILDALEDAGLMDKTVAVRRVGLAGESVTSRLRQWDGQKPSYFTLLIAKRGNKDKRLEEN